MKATIELAPNESFDVYFRNVGVYEYTLKVPAGSAADGTEGEICIIEPEENESGSFQIISFQEGLQADNPLMRIRWRNVRFTNRQTRKVVFQLTDP